MPGRRALAHADQVQRQQRARRLSGQIVLADREHAPLDGLAARQIDRLPRVFAAQPANCAPIARAFLDLEPAEPRPTIAEGTAIAKPIRMRECLGVLQQSRGGAVMLSEAEIGAAALDLARAGVYVEPTCAQAAAAFRKLLDAGTVRPEERTVLVMTGTGLKSTPRFAELLGLSL